MHAIFIQKHSFVNDLIKKKSRDISTIVKFIALTKLLLKCFLTELKWNYAYINCNIITDNFGQMHFEPKLCFPRKLMTVKLKEWEWGKKYKKKKK